MRVTIWTEINNVEYINRGECEYSWYIKNPSITIGFSNYVQLGIDTDTFFNLLDNFRDYLIIF